MCRRSAGAEAMTNITRRRATAWRRSRDPVHAAGLPARTADAGNGSGPPRRCRDVSGVYPWSAVRGGVPGPYLSGRTTPRIRIEPAPASVTFRPGRGECTMAPSPTYIPTWLASLW